MEVNDCRLGNSACVILSDLCFGIANKWLFFFFVLIPPDNQLTSEKHTDEKPMKGIVMSSVAEFSITEASSKGTKNEKKLSAASASSLASLEKCREFTYIEDDSSVHQRDSDGMFYKTDHTPAHF